MQKYHKILTRAETLQKASLNILNFFEKTMLLHYDHMEIVANKSYQGNDQNFWPEIEEGIDKNREILGDFVQELKETGCQKIEDFNAVQHGYPSKVFHIIAHLLDGFVGIDTVFYNLLEDSHGLTTPLKETIKKEPHNYWLIHLEVSFASTSTASLIHGES